MIDNPTYIIEIAHKGRKCLVDTDHDFGIYDAARAISEGEFEDVTAVYRVELGKPTVNVLGDVVALVQRQQHVDFNAGRHTRDELCDWIDRYGGTALREPYEIDVDDERSQMDREDRAFPNAAE